MQLSPAGMHAQSGRRYPNQTKHLQGPTTTPILVTGVGAGGGGGMMDSTLHVSPTLEMGWWGSNAAGQVHGPSTPQLEV
jgi:hypothetical protein